MASLFHGTISSDWHFRPPILLPVPTPRDSPAAPPATDSKRRVSTQRPQSTPAAAGKLRKAQIGERQTTNNNDQGETPPLRSG